MTPEYKNILMDNLKEHEGLATKVYKCPAGKLTIGYGRNVQDKGITQSEAVYLLSNDIDEVLSQCAGLSYWNKLNDTRQCVIADMVFNLGMTGFKGFVLVNKALARGDYERAAAEMRNSKWYRQVGRRGEKLANAMASGKFYKTYE